MNACGRQSNGDMDAGRGGGRRASVPLTLRSCRLRNREKTKTNMVKGVITDK